MWQFTFKREAIVMALLLLMPLLGVVLALLLPKFLR